MNKKFKYKKSLLAAILSATLLAGCDGGGSGSSSDTPPVDSGTGSLPEVKPDPTPNPEPTPEPTPDPEPTPEPTPDPEPTPEPEPEPVPTKTGYLTLGGSLRVTGDITCNDESSDGFTFTPGDKVTCVAGNNTTIATFDTQSEAARSLRAVEKVSFSLEDAQELAGSPLIKNARRFTSSCGLLTLPVSTNCVVHWQPIMLCNRTHYRKRVMRFPAA